MFIINIGHNTTIFGKLWINRNQVFLDFKNDFIIYRSPAPTAEKPETPAQSINNPQRKILPRKKRAANKQELNANEISVAAYYRLAKKAKQKHTEIFAISVQDLNIFIVQDRQDQATVIELSNIEFADISRNKVFQKLFNWLYDKAEVFDKSKAEKLLLYRFYNYKTEFSE